MDRVPADVLKGAREALATQYPRHADDYRSGRNDFLGDMQAACRAIQAERERCAKIARAHNHKQWRDDEVAESVKTEIAESIETGQ